MCRSTEYDNQPQVQGYAYGFNHYPPPQRRLKIKAFFLLLSVSSGGRTDLPDSLTLLLLPRLNHHPLEINGSNIPPDSPAFLTLHRLPENLVFVSRDQVRTCDGLSFEVHLGQNRLLRGVFREGLKNSKKRWRMECNCVLSNCNGYSGSGEPEMMKAGVEGVTEAELCVALNQGAAGSEMILRERVAIVSSSSRRRRGRCRPLHLLEEIPEEKESCPAVDYDSGYCCDCDEVQTQSDGGDDLDDVVEEHLQLEMMQLQGVPWAVDVGFWVFCFGVAFCLSRASANSFWLWRRQSLPL